MHPNNHKIVSLQAAVWRDDPHLQLRGPRRPRQPGQDHHHHWQRGERRPGPVPHQHEVSATLVHPLP